MDIKGSRTEENLKKALKGEALAVLKYQFYKSKAEEYSKDFGRVFDEIIKNEIEHGKLWLKLIYGGEIPSNEINFYSAILNEKLEYCEVYPEYGRIAREEGFEDIAELFEAVADIEGRHAEEFEALLERVSSDLFFDGDECTVWKCLNCGHFVSGDAVPEECPVCGCYKNYFVKF